MRSFVIKGSLPGLEDSMTFGSCQCYTTPSWWIIPRAEFFCWGKVWQVPIGMKEKQQDSSDSKGSSKVIWLGHDLSPPESASRSVPLQLWQEVKTASYSRKPIGSMSENISCPSYYHSQHEKILRSRSRLLSPSTETQISRSYSLGIPHDKFLHACPLFVSRF